ncbi:MAG: carbon monoxide dehydrogenase [Anaerolinea sp.]|nr:carbon monoxide dehydrogenase [Anaerolinea sp.]
MKIEGVFTFNGPRPVVWSVLRDVNILATAIPGETTLKPISDNEYEGTIKLKIGPVSGLFAGKLTVADEVPPESCTLIIEGKGGAGFAKGTGHIQLIELPDNKTQLKYIGDLGIGGKLASVGQRMIDSVAKSMIKGGFEKLEKEVANRL